MKKGLARVPRAPRHHQVRRRDMRLAWWKGLNVFVVLTTLVNISALGYLARPAPVLATDSVVPLVQLVDETPHTFLRVHKLLDANNDGIYEGNDTTANDLGFHWGLSSADGLVGIFGEDHDFGTSSVNQGVQESNHDGYIFQGWFYGNDGSCSGILNQPGSAVTVPAGQTTTITLCNNKAGVITGTKYYDWNHNDQTDPGDQPLAGWTIKLYNEDWQELADSAVTDASGHYTFGNLPADDYYICEVVQNGWTHSPNPAGSWHSGEYCIYRVLGSGSELEGADFHNYLTGAIHGYKFNDTNADGIWNDENALLGGWTIFIDANGNGQLDGGEQSTQTCTSEQTQDASHKCFGHDQGWYWFSDLQPGAHTVCEVAQAGWSQTFPHTDNHNCHTVTVPQPGNSDTCVQQNQVNAVDTGSMCNFGNREVPVVTITKTDNHATAQPGETLTYQVTVTNSGNVQASNVQVDDTLPGFIGPPTDISDGGVFSSGHIIWNFLTIPGNSSKTLTYQAVINANMPYGTTILHNLASLGCSPDILLKVAELDLPPVCVFSGQASDDTSVSTKPTLSVTKTASLSTVNPLQSFTYTVAWSVAGTSVATTVTITDPLPSGLTFVSADNGGTFNASTGIITWSLGTKNPGDSGTVQAVVQATATVQSHQTISNVAELTSAESDPVFSAAAIVTTIVPQVLGASTHPDLSITKTVNAKTARPGEVVKYSLVVKNTGDETLLDIVVTDTLPKGLSFVSGTGKTKTFKLASLNVGASHTFTVDGRVDSTATKGNYVNTATAVATNVAQHQAKATLGVVVPTVLGLAVTGVSLRDYVIFVSGLLFVLLGLFVAYQRQHGVKGVRQ